MKYTVKDPDFTLGDWEMVMLADGTGYLVQGGPAKQTICEMPKKTERGLHRANNEANARVIAASTDAVSCLVAFCSNWPQFNPEDERYDTGVNGADLVDWLNDQAPYFFDALKKAGLLVPKDDKDE